MEQRSMTPDPSTSASTSESTEARLLPCGHDPAQQFWGRCRKCESALASPPPAREPDAEAVEALFSIPRWQYTDEEGITSDVVWLNDAVQAVQTHLVHAREAVEALAIGVHIDGAIYHSDWNSNAVDHDEFTDEFIAFIEAHSWTFGGGITAIDEDGNPVWSGEPSDE